MYRVAVLSVHTCPLAALGGKESGGMNVYIRDLSRELGRRGLILDVFTRIQDPEIPEIGNLGANARVVHLRAGPKTPYDKNLIHEYVPEFAANLREFARREKISYHLVHSHYWLSGLVARELRREWRVPIIQMFHTLGQLKNQVASSAGEREIPKRVESEREIMGFADRLIAASPLEKTQMTELYGADPTKIDVIPCGVDLELFRRLPRGEARAHIDIPPNHKMVLFVGRIERLKGIDVLMEAMALALREMNHLRGELCLCIIGGDPDAGEMDREMARLQQMREKLGISDVVTFLGKQNQDALPYYFSAAEVCVIPSHYESFGMVALEAMACGTPVIASKVGGLTYTIEHGRTGFLVPKDDRQALAHKLKLLLTNESLGQYMGQQAIELAKGYSWSVVGGQMVALYRELVTRSRPQICSGNDHPPAQIASQCSD